MEQDIETPAISLVEKIVEMPVIRKTQRGVNTYIQHVVNAVEVEKHVVQEKINQETKRIEIPPLQFMDKANDILVVAQRQVPQVHVVKKTVEDPQFEIVQKTVADKVVDVSVVLVVQAPQVQVSEKTVEISQLQAADKIVETRETQTIQGIQIRESLDTAPLRQVHLTGAMKPDDPDAKIKFFTEEALHGVGGFIFDANGNRVANELRGQNCGTGEMWKNKPPFSLALNNAVSDDIAWHYKHYTGCGVRKLHESGTAPAEDMEALVSKTPDSIEAHYQAFLKRPGIRMESRTPRLRAISHGMKLPARQGHTDRSP